MIEHVIAFSIRQRWLVIAAAVLLAAWGVFAIYHTPIDAIPDLSENQVIVFTDWPGHSPQEIEDQVTFPLSLNLQGMAGVRVVRSSSDVNFSMLHVIFEDSVDVPTARRRVDEQLTRGAADLPAGVRPYLAPEAPMPITSWAPRLAEIKARPQTQAGIDLPARKKSLDVRM